MNTIECFTVMMIIALGLFPYENNAGLSDQCTTSLDDIKYKTEVKRFEIYLKNSLDDSFVSPFHDIPLNTGQQSVFRAVIIMPQLSRAEKEINSYIKFNPITNRNWNMNSSNAVLPWNYGALPQTLENKFVVNPNMTQVNDGRMLEVIVISQNSYDYGEVVNVKVFGIYQMLALVSNRINWKIIAIDAKDQRADRVNNIKDFNREFPDLSITIKRFLERLDVRFGEKMNQILEIDNAPAAVQLVKDKHNLWKIWQESEEDEQYISAINTTLNNKWTMTDS